MLNQGIKATAVHAARCAETHLHDAALMNVEVQDAYWCSVSYGSLTCCSSLHAEQGLFGTQVASTSVSHAALHAMFRLGGCSIAPVGQAGCFGHKWQPPLQLSI